MPETPQNVSTAYRGNVDGDANTHHLGEAIFFQARIIHWAGLSAILLLLTRSFFSKRFEVYRLFAIPTYSLFCWHSERRGHSTFPDHVHLRINTIPSRISHPLLSSPARLPSGATRHHDSTTSAIYEHWLRVTSRTRRTPHDSPEAAN